MRCAVWQRRPINKDKINTESKDKRIANDKGVASTDLLGFNKLTSEQLICIEKLASWDIPNLKEVVDWNILGDLFFTLLGEASGMLDKEPNIKSASDNIWFDTK